MDWIALLSKLRIVDVKPKAEQLGIINIRVENNQYNFPINDPEVVEKLKSALSPDFDNLVKEEVKRQLEPLSPILKLLSDSTNAEIISATAVNTISKGKFYGGKEERK